MYDFLIMYTETWSIYSAIINNLNKELEPFYEVYDKLYQQEFVGYPIHPKSSLWRIMVKIWYKHVYQKNEMKIL